MITQGDFEKSVLGYLSKSDPVTPELIRNTIHHMIMIQIPDGLDGFFDVPRYTAKLCEYFHKRLLGEALS